MLDGCEIRFVSLIFRYYYRREVVSGHINRQAFVGKFVCRKPPDVDCVIARGLRMTTTTYRVILNLDVLTNQLFDMQTTYG